MKIRETPLFIPQGTDWSATIELQSYIDGSQYALAGSSFVGEARRDADDSTPAAFAFTFAINTTTNIATASVAASVTSALDVGKSENDAKSKFHYDFKWTDSAGKKHRFQQGSVTVYRQITP